MTSYFRFEASVIKICQLYREDVNFYKIIGKCQIVIYGTLGVFAYTKLLNISHFLTFGILMPTYANCLASITDYLASANDYSTFSNDFIKVDTFLVKLTNLATEASKRKKDVIFVFCA